MRWRGMLGWAIMALLLLPAIFSMKVAAAVVHAVGIETLRGHVVLTAVYCVAIGVLLGTLGCILDAATAKSLSQTPTRARWGSLTLILLLQLFSLTSTLNRFVNFFDIERRNDSILTDISLIYLGSFICGLVFAEILQMALVTYRQRHAVVPVPE